MNHIRIVKTPPGAGLPVIREPYVGCTFPLADPTAVQAMADKKFTDLVAPLELAYSVAFSDVIRGLESAGRYDWVNHLIHLLRPQFIRFPVECAELIEA